MIKLKLVQILFLLIIFINQYSFAQTTIGKIIDCKTKQPVPGVYVSVNSKPITATNENGLFYLSNVQENDTINISHLIFENRTVILEKWTADTLLLKLKPNRFSLNEVYVVESKVKQILKRAHKIFEKQYQPINCWTKAKYKHLLYENGKPVNFLESHGYAMLRKPRKEAFGGSPLFIEENTRRTEMHGEKLFWDKRKSAKSIPFNVFLENSGDFAFCHRIFPLGKFNFKDYSFVMDTLSDDNQEQYVINFQQQSRRMNVSGWKLWGASGKLWIDRKSFLLDKMTIVFKLEEEIKEYCIDFMCKGKMIFPHKIQLKEVNTYSKHHENYYAISQFDFSDVDTKPRINYCLKVDSLYYVHTLLSPKIKYNPSYWKKYPVEKLDWYSDLTLMCPIDFEVEFTRGGVEPVLNKDFKYYFDYVEGSVLFQRSMNFVNQMKVDLKIKN